MLTCMHTRIYFSSELITDDCFLLPRSFVSYFLASKDESFFFK